MKYLNFKNDYTLIKTDKIDTVVFQFFFPVNYVKGEGSYVKILNDIITQTSGKYPDNVEYNKARIKNGVISNRLTSKSIGSTYFLKYDFEIPRENLIKDYSIEEAFSFAIDSLMKPFIKDKKFETFKVETKRSNKNYPFDSMEISRILGGVVLKTLENVKVDVHNPEVVINVEIRLNGVFIYFDRIKGIGGYPVGSLGKGLLMLSGGIDSPVAGYLALKRGVRIEGIYFESPPHTSEAAKNKVIKLATELSKYSSYVKLHVVNFTEIQESILKNCPKEYLITIMRRMMYRISERIAKNSNCKVLINGESIGQVASQTLTSMAAINEVVNIPVIRPVACLDKLEIIDISKKIGTYDISILPFEDCCTIFVPEHPVINPVASLAFEYENAFDYEELIKKCVREHEIIKVTDEISKEHNDLL